MSTLIVKIRQVTKVMAHPDPETTGLEVAVVDGWESIIRKGQYKAGENILYVPPDAIVPTIMSDTVGATKYLAELPKSHELRETHRRVKAARLRGYPSFGIILPVNCIPDALRTSEDNLVENLNISKWEPPIKCESGDAERENCLIPKYTDIEHYRNFPEICATLGDIIITEKIHGGNCCVGLIKDEVGEMVYAARSHNIRRKQFNEYGVESMYWEPFRLIPGISQFIVDEIRAAKECNADINSICIYGELYGGGIQKGMNYGSNNHQFKMFDISINGTYISYDFLKRISNKYNIPMVPILYNGPYSEEVIKEYTDGLTTVCDSEKLNGFKGREGIVFRSVKETVHPRHGRMVFKSVSVDYLERN